MNQKIYNFYVLEKKWNKIYPQGTKNKKYILCMFPYPSGELHCGHILPYTIGDILSRYYSMLDYKVINPIGWDSFGLPAEIAAIEQGVEPKDWTIKNIKNMKQTMMDMNFNFNWDTEFATCDENYIKDQQKLFIKLWEKGWIYKKPSLVNWDPVNQTVLANEQVIDGKAWRSGAIVEQKVLNQWFFKLSALSEDLLDFSQLDWPSDIINLQKQWIGKSHGHIITFHLINGGTIDVFTTKANTLNKVNAICVSATKSLEINLQLGKEFLQNKQDLKISEAYHPSGRIIPVYVTEYVLDNYGTGAIMCVPNYDERDKIFTEKNNLSIIETNEAIDLTKLEIKPHTSYSLKDWCISRQRKWGCPIPLFYCENCGYIPIDICGKCGKKAYQETDTMDTFVDSSWYYLKYTNYNKELFDKNSPAVDLYIGGKEHASMHLIYARFMTKVFNKIGLLDINEPFKKFIANGVVCGPYFYKDNKYYPVAEIDEKNGKYFYKNIEVNKGPSIKMSKSFKNGINPKEILDQYGSDALKLFILSDTPVDKNKNWNTRALNGCSKFLNKIWSFSFQVGNKLSEKNEELEQLIYEINIALQTNAFNVYIAKIRILFNKLNEHNSLYFYKFLCLFSIICPCICQELLSHKNWILKWFQGSSKDIKTLDIYIDGQKIYQVDNEITPEKIGEKFNIIYKKYILVPNRLINFITK